MSTRSMRALEPAVITLLDGQEHKFLLTKGALKKLCAELSVDSTKALMDVDVEKVVGPLFRHAHLGEALTDEQLDELIPVSSEWWLKGIALIFGASLPENTDPNPAAPARPEPDLTTLATI